MVLLLTACSPQPSPTTSPSLGLMTPPATVRTSDPTVGVSDGARLDVDFDGSVTCSQFPYSCAATVSVLAPGTVVDADWRPPADDPWFGADWDDPVVGPPPFGIVPALPPGEHRLLVSLLGGSDVPSPGADGRPATDLLARCHLDIVVETADDAVAVVVTFTPDGVSYGGTCAIERVD